MKCLVIVFLLSQILQRKHCCRDLKEPFIKRQTGGHMLDLLCIHILLCVVFSIRYHSLCCKKGTKRSQQTLFQFIYSWLYSTVSFLNQLLTAKARMFYRCVFCFYWAYMCLCKLEIFMYLRSS